VGREKKLRLHLGLRLVFMRYTLASGRPQLGLPIPCERSKCP
jgi:hypothetical protein